MLERERQNGRGAGRRLEGETRNDKLAIVLCWVPKNPQIGKHWCQFQQWRSSICEGSQHRTWRKITRRVGVALIQPSRLEKQLVSQPSVKAAKPLWFKGVQKWQAAAGGMHRKFLLLGQTHRLPEVCRVNRRHPSRPSSRAPRAMSHPAERPGAWVQLPQCLQRISKSRRSKSFLSLPCPRFQSYICFLSPLLLLCSVLQKSRGSVVVTRCWKPTFLQHCNKNLSHIKVTGFVSCYFRTWLCKRK